MRHRFLRWWHALYVDVDPLSMRRAEERERREKVALSSVVSVRVETAEQRRHREFWEWADARERLKQTPPKIRRIA